MDKKQKEQILKIIDERLNNSGLGYLRNYPEDDVESRRDWGDLHDDWSNAIYGLLEIKDIINEL